MTEPVEAPTSYSAPPTSASEPTRPNPAASSLRSPNSEYAELKRRIKAQGLLEKQPRYYATVGLVIFGLLALSIAVLLLVDSLWIQLLNAVLLAFVFTQISFLGHDATHRQIFRSTHTNNVVGTMFWNVFLGMSNRWFIYRHNRHHARPNELEGDPDADLIVLSFSERQAHSRRGLLRFFVGFQVFLLPLLAFEMIVLRYASYRFFIMRHTKYPAAEVLLSAVSLLLYLGLQYYALGLGPALLFITVHQLAFGLYFSSVIASNHKGMPFWDEDQPLDFLRQQVLTSRNVMSHPLTDFWYGGLNYQIEHHLFPNMPRNNLRAARVTVRRFCQEQGIAYYETGLRQSFAEVVQSLRGVSATA